MAVSRGRTTPWNAALLSEVEAVGSNSGVNVGDQCIVSEVNRRGLWVCTATLAATSTWESLLSGDPGVIEASPVFTTGDGTGTPTLLLDKAAGSENRIDLCDAGVLRHRILMSGSEHVQFDRYNASAVYQGTQIKCWASGNVTFDDADVSVTSLSPTLTVGSTGGTNEISTLQLTCDNGGSAACYLNFGNGVAVDRCQIRTSTGHTKLIFKTSGTDRVEIDGSALYPTSSGYDIGKTAASNRVDVLYVNDIVQTNLIRESYHSCNASSSTKYYLPNNYLQESTSITYYGSMVAPYDGRVASVQMFCSGVAGSTTIAVHKNESATTIQSKTETVAASTTQEFIIPGTGHFSKGDRVHISCDTAVASNNTNFTVVWEFQP